jgi:hypothetical protein
MDTVAGAAPSSGDTTLMRVDVRRRRSCTVLPPLPMMNRTHADGTLMLSTTSTESSSMMAAPGLLTLPRPIATTSPSSS